MNPAGQRAEHRPGVQQEPHPSATHSSVSHQGLHPLSPAEESPASWHLVAQLQPTLTPTNLMGPRSSPA